MDQRWSDPEAPWWARLRRARNHISEVQQRISALQETQPWSIQREPTGPDGWAYLVKIHRPIPADLSAAVGDAVANMRAALDYIAYELARHHVGTMNDSEEAATEFPICKDKAAFEQFFTTGRKARLRSRLYGEAERNAFRCVQPFALTEEMRAMGVDPATDSNTDLLTDHAYGLNALWNIDKHRRLPGLAWAVEGPVWFSGDEEAASGDSTPGNSRLSTTVQCSVNCTDRHHLPRRRWNPTSRLILCSPMIRLRIHPHSEDASNDSTNRSPAGWFHGSSSWLMAIRHQ